MNWLTNFIRPKIQSFVTKKDVPENLWHKCPSCEAMLFHRDLKQNQNVCYHCNHHMMIDLKARMETLFDDGEYTKVELPKVPVDPLRFKDRKRYSDRLKEAQSKTGEKDALIIAQGAIGGQKTVIAAMNFAFMGGSMGAAVGSGILKAARLAVQEKAAFITIPASGGARMQEGAISLMQMPRTILGVSLVKRAGLPYIVVLTHPTTGGVSASFAMVGDIHIAEPGAMIGFAGKRVIQETIREELPEDFQTAEYLLEHGMVDMVTHRKDIPEKLSCILNLLMDKKKSSKVSSQTENQQNDGGRNRSGNSEQKAAKDKNSKKDTLNSNRQSLRDLMSHNLGNSLKKAKIRMDPANNNMRIDPSAMAHLTYLAEKQACRALSSKEIAASAGTKPINRRAAG